MTFDNSSPPGSWAREMKARGLYTCESCGWVGRQPSTTESKSVIERDGRLEINRTHLLVCPKCFKLINRSDRDYLEGTGGREP